MQPQITRSLIKQFVRMNLKDLKESPERTTRNLVDMALQFSQGRFQKRFFEIAQEMLHNEHSPYYQLLAQMALNVESERLLNFGMNVGYNSFFYGADLIRKNEKENGFNIPWCITLELNENLLQDKPEAYHQLLNEGKALGIYTWHIFSNQAVENLIPIMEMNADCAFLLYCKAEEITERLIDVMAMLNNVMFVVEYDENNLEPFSMLQSSGQLYSAYYCYDDNDIPSIENRDLFCIINETNSVFAILFAKDSCSENTKKEVHKMFSDERINPSYRVRPFEFSLDNEWIDTVISDDACSVWFDKNGYLASSHLNCFQNSLSEILNFAFHKKYSQ